MCRTGPLMVDTRSHLAPPRSWSARPAARLLGHLGAVPAALARGLIRAYQLSFSMIFGRTCRHLPSCSEYADEAIARYGLWPGLWMGLARFCRCNPLGSHGFDPVPEALPPAARWYTPWRYGRWTGRHIEHKFYTD
jgi:uncharacterized protein